MPYCVTVLTDFTWIAQLSSIYKEQKDLSQFI